MIVISFSEAMKTLLFPVPSSFSANVAMYPLFNLKDETSSFKLFGMDSPSKTVLLITLADSPSRLFSLNIERFEYSSELILTIDPSL